MLVDSWSKLLRASGYFVHLGTLHKVFKYPMARPANSPRTPKQQDAKQLHKHRERTRKPTLRDWVRCVVFLVLASASCAISQLSLSPIYGNIPASTYHTALIVVSPWIWCLLFVFYGPIVSADALERYLPLQAWSGPAILHYVLAPFSSVMGPTYGPLITELVVLLPILFLIWGIVSTRVALTISDEEQSMLAGAAVPMVLGPPVVYLSKMLLQWYTFALALHPDDTLLTRWSLQTVLASHFTLLCPSKYLFIVIPLVLFQLWVNPHAPFTHTTAHLNTTLQRDHGFTLLDRIESTTGYLSVLESKSDEYRVLRCDHSLLGGNWLPTTERRKEGIVSPEPIYPVFSMLEAVRLMYEADAPETAKLTDASSESALVVGLGIGTAPRALFLHGINTTVIELDPAVTTLAGRWFDFPSNVTVAHSDALAWVDRAYNRQNKFDYVVHDVFTGGAEPLALFEASFLSDLKKMLKRGGKVAINYTGDLNNPHTANVLSTMFTVFNYNCRLYRESEAQPGIQDFTNLVVFCMKGSALEGDMPAWKFREAQDKDFLQSVSRRHSLPPRYTLEFQDLKNRYQESHDLQQKVKNQRKSAEDHWRIMRKVLPDRIWDLY